MWPEPTPILEPAIDALLARMRKEQGCAVALATKSSFTRRVNTLDSVIFGFHARRRAHVVIPVVARSGEDLLRLLDRSAKYLHGDDSDALAAEGGNDVALIEALVVAVRQTGFFWGYVQDEDASEEWPPGDFVVVAADEDAICQVIEEGKYDFMRAAFRAAGLGLLRVKDDRVSRWITRPRRRPCLDSDGSEQLGEWIDEYLQSREWKVQLAAMMG